MATLADLAALLETRFTADRFDGSGIEAALVTAAQREAPKRTGALARSLQAAGGAPAGAVYRARISMLGYGVPIQEGHRVASWGTSTHPRRHARYKTGGYVRANPFLTRAAASPEVREAVHAAILALLADAAP